MQRALQTRSLRRWKSRCSCKMFGVCPYQHPDEHARTRYTNTLLQNVRVQRVCVPGFKYPNPHN